jgi:hypothetical protein
MQTMGDAAITDALRSRVAARPVEDRLLLGAARLSLDGASSETLRGLLAERVDWACLARRAEAHAVAPLIYQMLSQPRFAELVPQTALAQLRGQYLANAVAVLLWQQQLERAVAQLNAAGITPVLLKGAALLHTVFPNPALRQLRDLDVLIHPEELAAAECCLLDLGYAPAEDGWPEGRWPPDWYEKKFRPQGTEGWRGLVEIHWRVERPAAPFELRVDELLRDAEPVSVGRAQARVLSPGHQVLHLCTHLAYNDGFGVGLSRPSDVHEAVQAFGSRLDWGRLAADARRFRASLCLRYALVVAAALFGTQMPNGLFETSADPPLRMSLAAAALERVLANDSDPRPLPATLARLASTDRVDVRAVGRFLLPRPRQLGETPELFHPGRIVRALRYFRSVW